MTSVKERLASAIALLDAENRLGTASIAEICRLANVSRANAYSTHRQLLDDARGPRVEARRAIKSKSNKVSQKLDDVAVLEARVMALRYICLELTIELEAEREKSRELADELRMQSPARRR